MFIDRGNVNIKEISLISFGEVVVQFHFLRATKSAASLAALAVALAGPAAISGYAQEAPASQQPAAGQQAAGQQKAGQPNWKDRAEYDLYNQIAHETDLKKRLDLLDQWTQKYPKTEFEALRSQVYVATLGPLSQQDPNDYRQKAIDTSKKALQEKPNDFQALYWLAIDIPAAGGASPTFSPLYQQIKGLITQSLESGEWKPGEIIPSEVELAVRYKVSQGTVRKAIDELAAENLLVRRQGKGTFVATHNEDRAQFRFLRLLAEDGAEHPHISKLLECRRLRAPAEIARQLDLKPADPVVLIKRLLQFDGVTTVLDEIWLPGVVFRGLTLERLNEYKGPLYAMFEAEFGTRMIRASEKIRAVSAEPAVAELLGVPAAFPLLSVERVSYTYGDRPVEVRRGWYVTTGYYYQNDLS